MTKKLGVLLALGALCLALPAARAAEARTPAGSSGRVTVYLPVSFDAASDSGDLADLAALLKRIAPVEGCSGGTCATGTNVVLNCPTSGGPTCGSGTSCSCTCGIFTPAGTWAAVNRCEAN